MSNAREVLGQLYRAARDGRIDLATTAPAEEREVNTMMWAAPQSHGALLAMYNSIACRREFAGAELRFVVVDEEGFDELNRNLVHRVDNEELSTYHLVGFAEAGEHAAWCFDITAPDENGEYPIYYFHRDEPRARHRTTGDWENPADATPDFPTFEAWFEAMTDAFTAAQPPNWFPYLGQPGLAFTG
jgi:hypothetical protein